MARMKVGVASIAPFILLLFLSASIASASSSNATNCTAVNATIHQRFNASCAALTAQCDAVESSCKAAAAGANGTACRCMKAALSCLERLSAREDVRRNCSGANSLYLELLSVAAGESFADSELGVSCRAHSCLRNISCDCADAVYTRTVSQTFLLTQPPTPQPPGPSTSPPAATDSAPPPAPAVTPASTAPLPPSPPGSPAPTAPRANVVSLVLQGTVEQFRVATFVQLLASVMNVATSRIVVLSVTDGSVLVKFFFTGSNAAQLTTNFLTNVAVGNNQFTVIYQVLDVSVREEDVSAATPVPGLGGTTSAPSPTNATAAGGDDGSLIGGFTMIEFIGIIVGGVIAATIFVIVVYRCVSTKDSDDQAKGNRIRKAAVSKDDMVTVMDFD